jgi:hypothetical protein
MLIASNGRAETVESKILQRILCNNKLWLSDAGAATLKAVQSLTESPLAGGGGIARGRNLVEGVETNRKTAAGAQFVTARKACTQGT